MKLSEKWRIKLILMLLAFSFVNVTAQEQLVTIGLKNATLKELFSTIEKQTTYRFAYRNVILDNKKDITISVENAKVPTILEKTLADRNLEYKIISEVSIVISDKRQSKKTEETINLNGLIVDNTNAPIIGAAVVAKNSSAATTTDLSGRFSLAIPANSVLVVSSIGYTTQEISVDGRTSIRLILNEDEKLLKEVVVIGYGVQKKSVVTAAISSVKSDDLARVAPTRIDNVLKGMVSGVSITQSSGQPGDGSRVRIRGVGTINNSEPLYIVDGMPIGGGINYLNPSDVESVEVLKDAASAAIYGSRAANGVILVTTKSGIKGKASLEYNTSLGWQNPWRKRSVLNAMEYATLMNERRMNDGETPLYPSPESYGEGVDWQDAVFNHNAPVVDHQISLRGGTDKANYYLSLGYLYQEGIVGGNLNRSNYERYSTRFNNNYIIWDDKDRNFFSTLKVGSNISYARINSRTILANSERGTPLSGALMMSPLMSVYAENSEEIFQQHPIAVTDFEGNPFTIVDSQYGGVMNPVAMLHLPGDKDNSDKIVANFWAEIELYKNLKFKSSYGTDLSFWGNDGYVMPYYLGVGNYIDESSVWSSMNRSYTWGLLNKC